MRANDYALKMNEWLIYQKNTKKSISAHLDFIEKRIHAEHSTLDHLATWYGEKSRLMPTDKSNGVFDFSLALNGMYKVPEYYSKELEDKYK